MAEFRDISLFEEATNLSRAESQERYIQISSTHRINLYEVAKLSRYVDMSDLNPSGEGIPSEGSLIDYMSYLLGHSLRPEYVAGSEEVTVNGGSVVNCSTVTSVTLDLTGFKQSTGWNYHQNTAVITVFNGIPNLTKDQFTLQNTPDDYTYQLKFSKDWNTKIVDIDGAAKITIEYVGVRANVAYFFVSLSEYESQ